MFIVQNPNKQVIDTLGEQTYNPKFKYRLIKHILTEQDDNGIIIWNSLTKAIVYLSHNEFDNIYNYSQNSFQDFLIKNYFLVPIAFNEENAADKVVARFKIPFENFLKEVHVWTILTTTDCNARCWYCYEKGRARIKMSDEVANKTADFIIEQYKKTNNTQELRWFGGEPTYNQDAINIITSKLTNAGVPFTSFFTTNGFLMNYDTVEKAVRDWHLTAVQITIDGTKDIYNKAKNYIYKDTDPSLDAFSVVTENIQTLLNNNIGVSIRMNLEIYNADDLKELVRYLKKRFGNHSKLHPYVWPIFDDDQKRTEDHKVKLYQKLAELEDTIKECGFYRPDNLNGISYQMCMVDGGHELLISPDGHIGMCEHFSESEFVSDLDNPQKIDWVVAKSWTRKIDKLAICGSCPIYPSCYKIKKCVELSKCDKYVKEWNIRKKQDALHQMLLNFYNNRNQQNRQQQNNVQMQQNSQVTPVCEAYESQETKLEKYKSKMDTIRIGIISGSILILALIAALITL